MWGVDLHQGCFMAADVGDLHAVARREQDSTTLLKVVRCSCGWHGSSFKPGSEQYAEAFAEWEDVHVSRFPTPPGRLILRRDAGGLRHFLDGNAVHAGEFLELRLPKGVWVLIRYEWNWQSELPHGVMLLGGPAEEANCPSLLPDVVFQIPGNAELRWPERRRS